MFDFASLPYKLDRFFKNENWLVQRLKLFGMIKHGIRREFYLFARY